MGIHGAELNAQFIGDEFAAVAGGNKLDNFQFPFAEGNRAVLFSRFGGKQQTGVGYFAMHRGG